MKDFIVKLGYTIIYVENVIDTMTFYEKAFGLSKRFLHETETYGEMETGDTVLSFASETAAEEFGFKINLNPSIALSMPRLRSS